MRLDLPAPPATFRSAPRRAGIATERWAAENLYCPNCTSRRLEEAPTNEKVVDFACPRCDLQVQLKAKSSPFGRKFANSAYAPKVEAIRARRMPDYALLSYDPLAWRVRSVEFLPGFFLTEQAIERRRPLSATARRAGWVGSNVVLAALPPDARVAVVEDGHARSPAEVRGDYRRFGFLRRKDAETAGWMADVLREVRAHAPPGTEFEFADFYGKTGARLARRYPQNLHVREKMRQKFQDLVRAGILTRVRRGRYLVVG